MTPISKRDSRTAEACERLFALMDNQPSKVRPLEHDEAYQMMWAQHSLMAHETPLYAPLLAAAPVPPPLHPQTSVTDSAAL